METGAFGQHPQMEEKTVQDYQQRAINVTQRSAQVDLNELGIYCYNEVN
jgi:hypothetical protein